MATEKKGNKAGPVRKETDNKPEAAVSVDQPQSDYPGLVPQISGKLTSTRIWVAQVMVEHFSDITYVHLIKSTSQDKSLEVNVVFEGWAATFGDKFVDIIQTMEYFLNNLSDHQLRIPTRQ